MAYRKVELPDIQRGLKKVAVCGLVAVGSVAGKYYHDAPAEQVKEVDAFWTGRTGVMEEQKSAGAEAAGAGSLISFGAALVLAASLQRKKKSSREVEMEVYGANKEGDGVHKLSISELKQMRDSRAKG